MKTYKSTLRACYLGFITQAILNNLAPLCFVIFQNKFAISYSLIGQLVLVNFGTQLITDIVAVKYADRIGHRRAMVIGHAAIVVGFVLLGVLPNVLPNPYPGLVIAVMCYAVGGGVIEVLASPIVDSLPSESKASAMTLLHSFYCWGQVGVVLITTLLIRLIGEDYWFVLPFIWLVIPLYNLFLFARVPLVPPLAEGQKMPIRKLLSSRMFLVVLLMMLCAGASELTMSQWSSLFAEKGLQVPKMLGDLLGPCLFAVFMGIGRTIFGIMGDKLKTKKVLAMLSCLCIACYLVTALSRLPILSLFSCALTGFSICLMWPGTFTLASNIFPNGGTAMFGLMAVFGDVGCSFGPWLAGVVSDGAQKLVSVVNLPIFQGFNLDQIGLKSGLFVGTLFPLLMLVGAFAMHKPKQKPAAAPLKS